MPAATASRHDADIGQIAAALRVSIGLLVRRLRQVAVDGGLTLSETSALARLADGETTGAQRALRAGLDGVARERALLGAGVREALAGFSGPVVYAANAMTQPGETVGFALSDHLQALTDHAGPVITDVLVHRGRLPEGLVARYEAEGASPVEVDREEVEKLGVRLREAVLLAEDAGGGARHDPDRLAEEVCEAAIVRL